MNKEYTKFVNPIAATKDNIRRVFSLKRIEITEELFSKLIPVMKQVHGEKYSERFWKMILGGYVNSLINRKEIFEKNIFTKAPVYPSNGVELPSFKDQLKEIAFKFAKNTRNKATKSVIVNKLKNNNSFRIEMPDLPEVKEQMGEDLPIHFPVVWFGAKKQKRKLLNKIAVQQKTPFDSNLFYQVPEIFVEYFDQLYNDIPLFAPQDKKFHIHVLNSDYIRMIVAKYKESGAKVFWYQHGAYYGEKIGHNAHYWECIFADEFRTWGWKIKDQDRPWKAYKLIKFKENFEKKSRTLNYDLLLSFTDVFDDNIQYFTEAMDYFFAQLSKEKYSRILARPRPMNKIQSHAFKLNFIKDERVKVASALGNVMDDMAQSAFVVQLTVPSTNFLECIAVDYPVIGILENDQPTDAIKPFYDFFLANGVLHLSMESLVEFLNQTDVEEWWKKLIIQPEYIQFKKHFANLK